MKVAAKLPRHSVIVYDEGRAGLESARSMEPMNKIMEDFFQECGQYGHVLMIVLPNFFKLHEDYAVGRSLFLVDCYTVRRGKRLERGYFNFYNEYRKEFLYVLGKKRLGVTNKYNSWGENFFGRFTKKFPLDFEEYEKKKRDALKKKALLRKEVRYKKQRNALVELIMDKEVDKNHMTQQDLADELAERTGEEITQGAIKHILDAEWFKKAKEEEEE
jgi:hypothetical protein